MAPRFATKSDGLRAGTLAAATARKASRKDILPRRLLETSHPVIRVPGSAEYERIKARKAERLECAQLAVEIKQLRRQLVALVKREFRHQSMKVIADRLGVSVSTVNNYLYAYPDVQEA